MIFCFFECTGDHRVLHVLTHSFPTRRSSDLEEEGLAEGDLVLDSVDYDEAGRAVIGGRASPGTRMRLYLDNRLVGDTLAGADGRWSHAPADPLTAGLPALRVDQVDATGQVPARLQTPFSPRPVRQSEKRRGG